MVSSPIPPAGHIPPQFLATLVDLDSAVTSTYASEKNAAKKMPAPKTKALVGLRQTLKKKNKELEIVLGTYNSVRLAAIPKRMTFANETAGPGDIRCRIC